MKIGLLGLGTVGAGVVEIIKKRPNLGLEVSRAMVKDIKKHRDIDLAGIELTDDFAHILNDEDIDIVVELTGDLDLAYEYIIESMKKGKHVVTANKAVVSKYFEEFSVLAEEKGLAFLYEASVGGGIPVLKPLREAIELNQISQVQGILNGTCNYILTRMINEDKDYGDVLKIAQDLGYAEADPTADVEGHDTLRKLRILATLGLQAKVVEEDILLYGISSINALDIENIKKMDSTVKLVAEAERCEDGFTAIVQPVIVKNDNYFSNVNMAFNSVTFKGDNVGELKFYGAGAGKLPTANAVLSDVMDILNNSYRKGNPLKGEDLKNQNTHISAKYYLRIANKDKDMTAIMDIAEEVLCKESLAILTKEIKLADINNRLLDLGLRREDYFLARIL